MIATHFVCTGELLSTRVRVYELNFKKYKLLQNINTKQRIKLQNEKLVLYETELDKMNVDIQYIQMMANGYNA